MYETGCMSVKFCQFSCFWKFSRNRLEGIQSRQAAHAILWCLWVPEMGPPVGTTLTARRYLEIYQFSGFLLELPGDNDQPAGDINFSPFLVF